MPGVAIPAPYGGTASDVAVDLDQAKLLAHGLTAKDVGAALALQNIVLPAGDQKIGPIDFMVVTNATPLQIESVQQPAHQAGRQCHRVSARRGLRPRGRPAAAEHRHGERASRRSC